MLAGAECVVVAAGSQDDVAQITVECEPKAAAGAGDVETRGVRYAQGSFVAEEHGSINGSGVHGCVLCMRCGYDYVESYP